MISSAHQHPQFSVRRALPRAAVMVLLMALGACDKKADGASKDGAADAPPAAPAGTADAKKPKATLKTAEVKSAYAAEFNDNAKMTDPTEKKVAAFVAKVGKPESDTGRKMNWYAVDGNQCTKIELDTKDGSLTDSTTSNADCGM